jgi:hypothetical protein
MQPPVIEGLAAAVCNWEAQSGNCNIRCSADILRNFVAVKTLSEADATPDLSTVAIGQTLYV